jgi:hypothetical protein
MNLQAWTAWSAGSAAGMFAERKNNRHFCSIYEIRPVLCRIFPFSFGMIDTGCEENRALHVVKAVILNSNCRPLGKAHREGVTYVANGDLLSTDEREERGYRFRIPILSSAFWNVLSCNGDHDFIVINGDVTALIW